MPSRRWPVICFATGETYRGWLEFLASRWSLALHALILIGMLIHVWTWFAIMPKTMPRLVIGGRYVEPRLITATGIAIASLASLLLLLIVMRVSQ